MLLLNEIIIISLKSTITPVCIANIQLQLSIKRNKSLLLLTQRRSHALHHLRNDTKQPLI